MRPSIWIWPAFALIVGCPTDDPKPSSTSRPIEVATAPAPDEIVPSPEDDGPPSPAKVDGTKLVPAVKVTQAPGECAPLAPLPKNATEDQKALRPVAEALRKVSCNPTVFGMSKADAIKALKLDTPVDLKLYRQAAVVELPKAVAAKDVVAAFGIDAPKMRAEPAGMRLRWALGTGDEGKAPKLWGVGELGVELDAAGRGPESSDEVADIPDDATVRGALRLVMPQDLLAYEDDPDAAAVVANAIIAIAHEPGLLGDKPGKMQARLGERYSVSPYSVGSGGEARKGFSIRPQRTELSAAALAKNLALPSPSHETIGIHDANPNRLASDGETEISWHGLELEVELESRAPKRPGLDGWEVTSIDVLPAK
jgi:hypothetical protein